MSHFRKCLEAQQELFTKSSPHERVYAGAANFGFMSDISQSQMMAQHEEQLQHLLGVAGSIIRTIGNGIAGQRFHVGRREKNPDQRKAAILRRKEIHRTIPKSLQHFSENVDILDEHTLIDTISKPNPLMGKFALIQNTFMCLEACGVMYWWFRFPSEENDLDHVQIWPLPPSWVQPVHENGKMFSSFRVCPTGFVSPIVIPGRNIGMFYYPDPANPVRPLSPMQMYGREVMVDEQIMECKRRHFLNGHRPGLAVIVGKLPGMEGIADPNIIPILTQAQREQLTDALNQGWRGSTNFNNPIFLDGMIRDVKQITNTVQEMDYLGSGDSALKRLCMCWGVSPLILGDMQNANRAGSVVAKKHFYEIVLNPRIAMFSEALTHQIAPLFLDDEDEDVVAWLEIPVAVDEDYELAKHIALLDRDVEWMNEARQAMGLEPQEGLDMPLSQWRSENGFSAEPHLTLDGQDDPAVKYLETVGYKQISDGRRLVPLKHKSWHDLMGVHGHVATLDRHATKVETELTVSLKTFFVSMGQDVAKSIREQGGDMVDPAIADILVHDSAWSEKMAAVVEPLMLKAGMTAALVEWNMHQPRKPKGSGKLSTKGAFDFAYKLPSSIIAAVKTNVDSLLEKISFGDILETVRGKIRKVISAIGGTKRPTAVADDVASSVFSDTESESHASTIARTSNTGAIGAGGKAAQDELGKLGLVNGKQWFTSPPNVRPDHVTAGKQPPVGLHEKFTVGGYQCDYPGDPTLPPAQLCNCKCYAVSVKVKR